MGTTLSTTIGRGMLIRRLEGKRLKPCHDIQFKPEDGDGMFVLNASIYPQLHIDMFTAMRTSNLTHDG
jgi:hypothetical protein